MDFNSANTISAFLSSILLLLIVCYIAFRDWRDLINRYYAFFALMISGMMLTMYLASAMQDSPHLTLISRMTRSFMMMSFFGYFSLSLIFSGSGKTFRALNVLLSAIPAVLTAIASASTDMVISRVYLQGGYALTEYGRFYWIFALMALLYLLAGIVNSIRKYLVMDVELYRLQMRYIFTGSSTALLFVAAVSLILPWWSGYSRLQVMGPAAASLLIIISLFYSVAVHNIMGINTNLHRTMIYILVSITVFVPIYAIIVFYYARMFHLDWLPLPVLALLIVGVFLIISTFIQPVIDRIFRRRRYEFETVTDSFLRRVEDVHDPLRVVDETVDALYQSLNLSSAFFLRYDPAVRSYGMISGRSAGEDLSVESLERNAPLILWFIRNHEILSLNRVHADREALSEIRDDAISFFSSAKISVILPYYHYNRLTGLLCLGPKISMAGFTSEEMGILEAFRQESNEVISTAVTYEMAREEQFIARTLSLSSYILSRSTPARLPHMQGIRFGGFVISRYGRGVDYFDFIRSSDEGIGVIAADVAGVGINSALYSVVLRSAFRSSVGEAQSTYAVAQNLNRVLFEYSRGRGQMVTCYYFYYDVRSMRLSYTNAGFPALDLFRIEKNEFDTLDTEGIPLGYEPDASYGSGSTDMLRGDIGIIYSRSLINSRNQQGEEFGLLRLRDIIKHNRSRRPSEISQALHGAWEKFMGLSSAETDILALIFKIG